MKKKSTLRKRLLDRETKKRAMSNISLTMLFAILIFFILLISIVTAVVIVRVLTYFGVFLEVPTELVTDYMSMLILAVLTSLLVGMVLAVLTCRFPLRSLGRVKTEFDKLSSGDYKANIHFGLPLGAHPAFMELEESFNKLAWELENTEMLRSDFINNFSHEFKTPIVSIAGFAKLLKHPGLTDEQRTEYIDIIEEESMRLANMATNVMNLTKVENQSILTDVTEINISEQIRSAVLLLESAWAKKGLDLRLDFGEHVVEGSEELLKEVWINLIDNAVKYAPEGGYLSVEIDKADDEVEIRISNPGDIPLESKLKIWNKFYQADESHSSIGNGIGLSIVRRVIEIHRGSVNVQCEGGSVTFFVSLPIRQ